MGCIEGIGYISYLSDDPKGKSRETEFRLSKQRRVWKVEWQKHHIPQEVLLYPTSQRIQACKDYNKTYLTCADLVKRDKRKRLSQHGTCQILLCQ
jgi:hypothetical protein